MPCTRTRERPGSNHDMGGDIIPEFVAQGEAGVYDLNRNEVPGRRPTATATTGATWARSSRSSTPTRTSISALPVFNLYNREWPIYTQTLNSPPAKFVRDGYGQRHVVHDSIVSLGCCHLGRPDPRTACSGRGRSSSPAPRSSTPSLFDRVRIGADAVVQRAILDKNVVIAEGARVGVEHERDRERGLTVTDSGIVVVGKGVRVDP